MDGEPASSTTTGSKEVEREPHLYRDDLGRIGRILGWTGIGLALAGLLVTGALLAVLFAV